MMIVMDLLIFTVPLVDYLFEMSIYQYVIKTAYTLLEVGVTGSIYSTIAVSAERYLVVCHPFYADSHHLSTKTHISLVSVFSLIYNIPTIFELQTFACEKGMMDLSIQCQDLANIRSGFVPEAHNCSYEKVLLVPTELRCNKHYFLIYHVGLDLCFKCIIPFFTLSVLNCVIIKTLFKHHVHQRDSKIRRKASMYLNRKVHNEEGEIVSTNPIRKMEMHDIKLAITNLVIVIIFVVCHSIIWIPKIYEAFMGTHTDIKTVFKGFKLGYFFTALNSSINCYVYFFTHYNPIDSFKCWLRKLFQKLCCR